MIGVQMLCVGVVIDLLLRTSLVDSRAAEQVIVMQRVTAADVDTRIAHIDECAQPKMGNRGSACAWFLAAAFVATGVWKTLDFSNTVQAVQKLVYVRSNGLAMSMAIGVIVLEFVLATALVFGWTRKLTAVILIFFSTSAVLLHAYSMWTGDLIACGCAGRLLEPVTGYEHHIMLVVSVIMLTLSTLLFLNLPVAQRPQQTRND